MKIKIGIVGLGNIFDKHYAVIKNNKFFKIIAFCDKNYKIKVKNSSISFYSDIQEMLSKEKEIELVILLTPSGLHFGQIKMCLSYDKDIIVEKPICLDFIELKKIISLQDIKKKKIFTVYQNRKNTCIEKLKNYINKKKIGKIFFVNSSLTWSRNKKYYQDSSWRGKWNGDRGVICNQGIHNIDLICNLFGEVKHVYTQSERVLKYSECEDTASSLIRFKNNILCNMNFTTASSEKNYQNLIEVHGTKGKFLITGRNLDVAYFNNKKICKNNNNLFKLFYKDVIQLLVTKKKINNNSAMLAKPSIRLMNAMYVSLKKNRIVNILNN
jgi:UDP-N-acetyl-2-amino-2-deoxyglucuronate dehydrogenase